MRRAPRATSAKSAEAGKLVLSMTVRGTEVLRNWILGLGPFLQVLRPRELRQEAVALLRDTASLL